MKITAVRFRENMLELWTKEGIKDYYDLGWPDLILSIDEIEDLMYPECKFFEGTTPKFNVNSGKMGVVCNSGNAHSCVLKNRHERRGCHFYSPITKGSCIND